MTYPFDGQFGGQNQQFTGGFDSVPRPQAQAMGQGTGTGMALGVPMAPGMMGRRPFGLPPQAQGTPPPQAGVYGMPQRTPAGMAQQLTQMPMAWGRGGRFGYGGPQGGGPQDF